VGSEGVPADACSSSGAATRSATTLATAPRGKAGAAVLHSARSRSRVDARQMVGVTRKEVYVAPGRAAPARL
jgi:hypothetical protein